jgi:hypothetical protein
MKPGTNHKTLVQTIKVRKFKLKIDNVRYENSYPSMKVRIKNNVVRYENSHLGTKIHTYVRKFTPRYNNSHPGKKLTGGNFL